MRRPFFRRTLRLEALESREVLSSGGPSAEAQYMLSMVNLARTDPQAAAQKFTTNLSPDVTATLNYYNVNLDQVRNAIASSTPRPPVAWNDTLAQAATGMATDQAVNGFQSHTGSDGSNLETRLDRVGYTNRASDGENTYAYSESVDNAMEAFLIDWGVSGNGHRNNLLQPNATPDQYYKEVGIGVVPTQNSKVGPLVITQDFGTKAGAKADLLGVAFNDNNGSGVYAQGEGVGNVEVDATNNATGQTSTVMTWDNGGGYQIPLDPGYYTVTSRLNGKVLASQQVVMESQNIEVDYNVTALEQSPNISTQAAVPQAAAHATNNTPAPAQSGAGTSSSGVGSGWSTWYSS